MKGTGGALDFATNAILIIVGIVLILLGTNSIGLDPIFVTILGIFLIISQIVALIG